ncbi:MAG: response regulator [Flavobacterium sp.]|nr:response regulator [Flavobacterium sp.]
MENSINIFIVDDHPMTVDSYINLLSENNTHESTPNFIISHNCEEAYKKIKLFSASKQVFDLALIDVNLPPFESQNIKNGIDLASMIRREIKGSKVVLLTMHSEPLVVDQIIKRVNPDGFISKNDVNFETFKKVCVKIIKGELYYSSTIIESQKELVKINVNWDKYDTQILILISEGVKNINLPNYIPLSMSAIEKRKANIKEQLLLGKGNDKDLIDKAKKLGLL